MKLKILLLILYFALMFDPVKVEAGSVDFYTIKQLNNNRFNFGTYLTEGYVFDIISCKDCDNSEECLSRCSPSKIRVSQEKRLLRNYYLSDSDLIIFVDNADTFEVGKKYQLLIHILDVRTEDQKLNNIQLIYFQEEE